MSSLAHAHDLLVSLRERCHVFMLAPTKRWLLEELHELPEDSNRYEVIRGMLFVTPAPTYSHQEIVARLTHLLVPYVTLQQLGFVFHPRAVLQYDESQVEPDLMVRQPHPDKGLSDWSTAPTPSLVVEVASRSTRARDKHEKRSLYSDAGVPEYWIVDGLDRTITVVRAGARELVQARGMAWHPHGATEPLEFDVADVFGEKRS